MPELPEIESIRRYLVGAGVVGREIVGVDIKWDRCVAMPLRDPDGFTSMVSGYSISDVGRRGKYLVIGLTCISSDGTEVGGSCSVGGNDDSFMILHMGMTGSLHVRAESDVELRHTRTTLWLDDGHRIELNDPRKWSKLWVTHDVDAVLSHLGPDPWDISGADFAERIGARRSRVKSVLLDQSLVAGVGNIYADESLHLAGISPMRRANRISKDRLTALHSCIVEVLGRAIEFIDSHPSPDGSPYVVDAYDDRMQLGRRSDAKCPSCGTGLKSRVIGGRTAYYCLACQR